MNKDCDLINLIKKLIFELGNKQSIKELRNMVLGKKKSIVVHKYNDVESPWYKIIQKQDEYCEILCFETFGINTYISCYKEVQPIIYEFFLTNEYKEYVRNSQIDNKYICSKVNRSISSLIISIISFLIAIFFLNQANAGLVIFFLFISFVMLYNSCQQYKERVEQKELIQKTKDVINELVTMIDKDSIENIKKIIAENNPILIKYDIRSDLVFALYMMAENGLVSLEKFRITYIKITIDKKYKKILLTTLNLFDFEELKVNKNISKSDKHKYMLKIAQNMNAQKNIIHALQSYKQKEEQYSNRNVLLGPIEAIKYMLISLFIIVGFVVFFCGAVLLSFGIGGVFNDLEITITGNASADILAGAFVIIVGIFIVFATISNVNDKKELFNWSNLFTAIASMFLALIALFIANENINIENMKTVIEQIKISMFS